jgi:broad specificity phosphatase PhoE
VKVYLVRHAEAAWPEEWLRADPGLSERGRLQATAVAAELRARGVPPAAVLSSPAARARATAAIVVDALGSEPMQVDDALEGIGEPSLRRKMAARSFDADLIEAIEVIQDGAWAVIERLREALPEATDAAVVVSHDSVIGAIVCRALSMPLSDLPRFEVDLASITVLEFRGQRTILAALNHTCQLATV